MTVDPKLTETPTRLPGACSSCGAGSTSREWFLDTGMDETDSPMIAIMYCDICFGILADAAGFSLTDGTAKHLRARISELEKEVNDYAYIRDALDFLGIDADHLNRIRLAVAEASSETSGGAGKIGSSSSKGKNTVRSGKKGSSESTDDEDLGELQSGEHSELSLTIPNL